MIGKVLKHSAIWLSLLFAVFLYSKNHWKVYKETGSLSSIRSDGAGHYAYLPAIFIYQDFNYEYLLEDSFQKTYGQLPNEGILDLPDGTRYTKYYIGTSILMTPFFLLAMLWAFLFNFPVDGYSLPFQVSSFLAALSYLLAGLWLLKKVLQNMNFGKYSVFFTLLAFGVGSNLLSYVHMDSAFSHSYLFFLGSALFYCFQSFLKNPNSMFAMAFTAVFILIGITRPTSILIVLALPFLSSRKEYLQAARAYLFGNVRLLLSLLGIAILLGSTQLLLYQLQVGAPFIWSYANEGFNFSDPHFIEFLFGFRKGLFVYSPVLYFSIFGLLIWAFRKEKRAWIGFGFFILITYILSSWWSWWFGAGFGSRAFIDFYPALAIPMASFLDLKLSYNYIKLIRTAAISIAILLGAVFQYQYSQSIIAYDRMDSDKFWRVWMETDSFFRWKTLDSPSILENREIFSEKHYVCSMGEPCHSAFKFSPEEINASPFVIDGERRLGYSFQMLTDSLILEEKQLLLRVALRANVSDKRCPAAIVCTQKGTEVWKSVDIVQKVRRANVWTDAVFEFTFGPELRKGQVLEIHFLNESNALLELESIDIGILHLHPL